MESQKRKEDEKEKVGTLKHNLKAAVTRTSLVLLRTKCWGKQLLG
jgi:hypothetical protein